VPPQIRDDLSYPTCTNFADAWALGALRAYLPEAGCVPTRMSESSAVGFGGHGSG
jgi:hypothetical protein